MTSAKRGVVEGAVAQHDDGNIEQAVDNSTKRTSMPVTFGAQLLVVKTCSGIRSDGSPAPEVCRIDKARITCLAP